MNDKIYVTKPSLPPLDEFMPYLEKIWSNHVLTNGGEFHQKLESALCEYLGVKHISLFCNGTIALLTALQALNIKGEVITTPFSFVATAHSIMWNGMKPVFVDIEPEYFNIDPDKIESAITDRTTAIMPVHVYGNPCDTDAIKRIADKHGLKVIYDAAHAFGVKKNSDSILNCGDLSVLSFHATKTYNTLEGGAIVCHDAEMKDHIDKLKNFGFAGETKVIKTGINGKMNEVQSAFGLLYLKYVDEYIAQRRRVTELYRELLSDAKGIRVLRDMEGVAHNYSYFPIFINAEEFGSSRDDVYDELKSRDIYCRRYFYPLITEFPMYHQEKCSYAGRFPVAERIASQVLCLPIYPDLTNETIELVCNRLKI
jgi:dTDP-4-amino-4,6-dideoxygalactose transaminase